MFTEFYQVGANDTAAMKSLNERILAIRKAGAEEVRVERERGSAPEYFLYVTITYYFKDKLKDPVPLS